MHSANLQTPHWAQLQFSIVHSELRLRKLTSTPVTFCGIVQGRAGPLLLGGTTAVGPTALPGNTCECQMSDELTQIAWSSQGTVAELFHVLGSLAPAR